MYACCKAVPKRMAQWAHQGDMGAAEFNNHITRILKLKEALQLPTKLAANQHAVWQEVEAQCASLMT